jgi:hypothetical protein
MRFAIYYPIHFFGIFLVFMSIGAMCLYVRNGGLKENNPSRKFLAISHGVGLLFIMTGGMGLMKAGGFGFQPFILFKLCIWLIVGSSSMIIYKKPKLATVFFFFFCVLGLLAGLAGKFKSFDVYMSFFQ